MPPSDNEDASTHVPDDSGSQEVDPSQTQAPAPRPCTTCPYRQDVPSGIWDPSEYEKLPPYDAPTPFQPRRIFQCHLTEGEGRLRRICAGWAGCHDGHHLLALRLAVSARVGGISPETWQRTVDYISPVPLFTSGEQAAAHGMRDILNRGSDAERAIAKILRVRKDILPPSRDRFTDTNRQEES